MQLERHTATHASLAHPVRVGFALAALSQAGIGQEPADAPALSVSAAYTGDWRRNTTGGMQVGNAYSDSLDLAAAWTTDSLVPEARFSANVAVMYLGGGEAITGRYVGDLQGLNNIEGPQGWRLYESWVEFAFGDGNRSVRAGVLDLNAEFDAPVTQGLFVGAPFGLGTDLAQTGEHGPASWPTTGFGVRAAGLFTDHIAWRVGAYDGAPGSAEPEFNSMHLSNEDGALLIGELEYASERFHKIALGSWYYTAAFEPIDAAMQPAHEPARGNRGVYAHFDLRLASLERVDLDGALRVGAASSQFNVFDRCASVAVTASHLWASRPGDSLGLGIAWARTGGEFRDLRSFEGQPATAAETQYELAYRAELTPWLSVQPSVQFVNSPGADPALDDAWIAGLRFELVRDHSWRLSARRGQPDNESYARSNL